MVKSKAKFEVGKEVESQCRPCKSDTIHVITIIDGEKIKKVMCKSCNATHAYNPPVDENAESEKPKRGRPRKTDDARKPITRRRGKKDWATLISKIEDDQIVDYDINKDYSEIEAIQHKTFGVGVITKILTDNKIEVVFEENKKILAQNWD